MERTIRREYAKKVEYKVGIDPDYFDGSSDINGLRVGDVFIPHHITEGYCYINGTANCFISRVRNATPKEIREFLKNKKVNLPPTIQGLEGRIIKLENALIKIKEALCSTTQ